MQPGQPLIKDEEKTDPKYGWEPRSRPLKEYLETGVINLDKPPGPSSHEVVAWIKRLLSLERAGHGGTLDPKVSGVLPITLGRSTRVISFIMKSGKEYVGLMELHCETDPARLDSVAKEFTGPIYQLPPVRSAVKRALRIRNIYSIGMIEREGKYALLRVNCEAGTYIRKLFHDMGEVLGCGAHMRELRRVRAGPFKEESSVTLHSLLDAITLWKDSGDESLLRAIVSPIEESLWQFPKIVIRDSAVDALCHGANLASPGLLKVDRGIKEGAMVTIMTLKGELVCFGRANLSSESMISSDHGIVAKIDRTVMPPGTYHKGW
jgi:H/ACA ribonucleoprotein complex subunit 4